jgi:Tfp pilus assembly protein PilN
VKAINLIPSDQRRGAGGAAGRTGGAAYAIVGGLAIALLMFGLWTVTNKQITEKTAQADSLEQQASARQAQAAALGPYTKFAELRANRVQTVKKLVESRFDWAHAMGELARKLPAGTYLTALTGTVAPGVGSDVGGASDPLRTARAVPALELAGCSRTQSEVSNFIGRLRLMNGVDRVSLSSSKKTGTGAAAGTGGQIDSAAGSGAKYVRKDPCTADRPAFSLVVFYEGLINPPGTSGKPELNKGGATPAPGQATPAPGQTTPAPAAGATAPAPGTPTTTTPTPTTQSAPAAAGGTQ